jgi:hypothetical protein
MAAFSHSESANHRRLCLWRLGLCLSPGQQGGPDKRVYTKIGARLRGVAMLARRA